MTEPTQYPIDDTEYMTPAQVAAMRELDRLRTAKAQEPQPETLTDSWLVDVAEHRRRNNTEGQESEE